MIIKKIPIMFTIPFIVISEWALKSFYFGLFKMLMKSEMMNSIRKITKSIFAMAAACTAIPVKPRTPATIATTKKSRTQFNMI